MQEKVRGTYGGETPSNHTPYSAKNMKQEGRNQNSAKTSIMNYSVKIVKIVKKCQDLQKHDKSCNRHKGCPNFYLVKKHGLEMDGKVSRSIKEVIHRKGWMKMMESVRGWDEIKDKGHPLQGTAGPPSGNQKPHL